MTVQEFKVNQAGMVALEKDGDVVEFAPESVPVWLAKGWKAVDPGNAVKNVAPLPDDADLQPKTVKVDVPEKNKKES